MVDGGWLIVDGEGAVGRAEAAAEGVVGGRPGPVGGRVHSLGDADQPAQGVPTQRLHASARQGAVGDVADAVIGLGEGVGGGGGEGVVGRGGDQAAQVGGGRHQRVGAGAKGHPALPEAIRLVGVIPDLAERLAIQGHADLAGSGGVALRPEFPLGEVPLLLGHAPKTVRLTAGRAPSVVETPGKGRAGENAEAVGVVTIAGIERTAGGGFEGFVGQLAAWVVAVVAGLIPGAGASGRVVVEGGIGPPMHRLDQDVGSAHRSGGLKQPPARVALAGRPHTVWRDPLHQLPVIGVIIRIALAKGRHPCQ